MKTYCVNCNRATPHDDEGRCQICEFLSPVIIKAEFTTTPEDMKVAFARLRRTVDQTPEFKP